VNGDRRMLRTESLAATPGWEERIGEHLDTLRRRGNVYPAIDEDGVVVALVTGYGAVRETLGNKKICNYLGHARPAFEAAGIELTDERIAFGAGHLVHADPPDHTRLRELVSRAFTPRRLQRLAPSIERIAEDLVGAIIAGEPVELVSALNHPLPVKVISEVLGVPAADRPEFRQWCEAAVTPEHVGDAPMNKSEGRRLLQAYLTDLVVERERSGNRDADPSVLGVLLQGRQEGAKLSTEEVVSMAYILFLAGHESTVNFLGNVELYLANHPELLMALRQDPDRIPRAVEELLRLEGPVQRGTIRVATEELAVADTQIRPGTVVSVCLAAANRDPHVFARADELDLQADRPQHLAFGIGPHFCVGAALARLEVHTVLRLLTARFRGVALDEEAGGVAWRNSFQRGPASLYVRWET